jgi:predicted nuclease with TOPRIM domain
MIVEGAIDALSAIALGSERSIVGLAGAANWNVDEGWVKRLGVKGHVLIALDADNSGNEQAKRLADFLSENKRNFRRHELPEGIKDLNEMLQFVSNMNHT